MTICEVILNLSKQKLVYIDVNFNFFPCLSRRKKPKKSNLSICSANVIFLSITVITCSDILIQKCFAESFSGGNLALRCTCYWTLQSLISESN